mmetsp:Transcript_32311/g.58952  ORF Transcript_32311/g.58952 Transcript_32311/m.58952 type:complete len:270 (-) Transcript_32311:37-846(-)
MAFITVLSLSCVLAGTHRIQPGSLINQRKSQSNILVSPESESVSAQSEQSASTAAAAATRAEASRDGGHSLEHQAHSLIQEQMSIRQTITQKFRSALNSERVRMFRENYLYHVPTPVLAYLAGAVLVALSFSSCCLVRRLTTCLPLKGARQQHLHNGNVVYEWDQTPNRATIYIRPPKYVSKSDLDIRISARHLRVARKGKPSFLREEIYELVNEEMSFWTLRSSGELQIYLKKAKKAQWPAVLLHKVKSGTHDSDPAVLSAKCKFTPS